ncbi:MAG: site-2 protease family protein [Methanobacteriaceae archaeon]|nr:site-2 protease family protein [Methanobacteriaceae archaeon]
MNALWFYAIAFVLIWTIALLFRDKLKIEVHGPLLMRKTQKMRGVIDKIAQRHKKFWRWTLNIGIFVAFFFMALMVYFLITSLQSLFVAPQASLIIPGVDLPGSPIFVPLGYGILALVTVLFVHEFGHGILARVEGISIKSIGLLLLAILPGAFVEPDEDEIKKSKSSSKLRIYAAGSIFNLMLAALSLLIVIGISSFIIPATFETDGIQISSVVPGSPATDILKEGMVVQSINGVSTDNITNYQSALSNLKIGQVVVIGTDQGTFNIKTAKNPNNSTKAYIGIRSTINREVKENVAKTYGNQIPWVWMYLQEIFNWIYMLNFLVGTFNLLPMKPLDGGLMLEEVLRYKLSDRLVKPIINSVSTFIILIIAISIIWGTGRGLLLMF